MFNHRFIIGTSVLIGLLLTGLGSNEVSGQTTQSDRSEFDAALGMLRDTSVRMDSEGILLTRTRLEPFTENEMLAAEAHYYLGLADVASLFSPDMTNQTAGPEETRKRIDRAMEALKTSIELDDASPEVWCLLALAEKIKSSIATDDDQQALQDASAQHIDRALQIDEADPVVMTAAGMMKLFSGGNDAMDGVAMLEDAVDRFRENLTGERDHDAGWWPLLARGMLARVGMMSGKNADALVLVNECLELEPDYTMAAMMKPQLESIVAVEGDGYEPIDANRAPSSAWTALAQDVAGDGKDESLADGKAFAYQLDTAAGKVWFRFELHGAVNADAFGVNIIVDSDADQSTGTNWWGANSDFTWERVVTVWVAKKDNGKYRGTVGVGDMAGMGIGDMASLHRGDVDFVILDDENAIIIAVPIAHLTDGDRINVIGAVGSNRMWNDDLQDEGYATIELR